MAGFRTVVGGLVLALLVAVVPVAAGGRAAATSHGADVYAHRVIDLLPGAGESAPFPQAVLDGYLYFVADDGEHGRELWRTNGTAAGTHMVSDIRPGPAHSHPSGLVTAGDQVFFSADDGVHGTELWRTDGTAAGTHLVRDIRPGAQLSAPGAMTAVGDVLFFNAYENVHERELWRSDGTEAGTVMVADINPGGSSSPLGFISYGPHVYFSADDGVTGRELWRSDGTAAGTQLVRDIFAGPGNSFIDYPVVFKGLLHFRARSGNVGMEVFRSDGTQAGTQPVTDLTGGGPDGHSNPAHLTVFGNHLYFQADDGVLGRELWRTPGGLANVKNWQLVADVNPGAGNSTPTNLTPLGDRLLFSATSPAHGRELWVTDGTPAGSELVRDVWPGGGAAPEHLTVLGDHVYFVAEDGVHGRELWRSDGTGDGTRLVADIRKGPAESTTQRLTLFDGTLFFSADDGTTGAELWRLSELPAHGVVRYGGSSRFETAALLSAASFEPGVPAVFVATGLDFPDALTGAVSAALVDAPVLLVTSASIPPATRDELERLQPGRIWILGGEAVISAAVEAELGDHTAGPVVRLSGPERFSTAAAVSESAFPDGADVVYVGTGLNFPDALTGVPAAAAVPGPLLLVTRNQVPAPTAAELDRLDAGRVVILGGTAAVGGAVAAALADHADVVERVSGPDRYATAAAIADGAFPEAGAVHTVFVATGNAFPDALAAGAVAGAIPGPVLLSQQDSLPAPTVEQLARLGPQRIVVMGGTAAISAAVEAQLATYLAE